MAAAVSWAENQIPLQTLIPVPGLKLGLANVVSAFALYTMGLPEALTVLTARCLTGALIGGNWTALLFSLSGGIVSVMVMAAARKSGRLSVYGVSVLGAAGFNTAQIGIAVLLMHSRTVWGYLPYLLLIGTACGLATATVLAGVLRALGSAAAGHSGFTEQERKK